MNTTLVENAIKSLDAMSEAFEAAANNPKHYNSSFSSYLDQMSFEMRKMKSELRECYYMIGE